MMSVVKLFWQLSILIVQVGLQATGLLLSFVSRGLSWIQEKQNGKRFKGSHKHMAVKRRHRVRYYKARRRF